jgi:DNA-binding FadR family transcriptional regulator
MGKMKELFIDLENLYYETPEKAEDLLMDKFHYTRERAKEVLAELEADGLIRSKGSTRPVQKRHSKPWSTHNELKE